MGIKWVRLATAALCGALAIGAAQPRAAPKSPPPAAAPKRLLPRFPDFGYLPAPGAFTPDRTFRLSQDFPANLPPIEPAVRRILSIDFTHDWRAYADAVLAYIMEGNIEDRGVSQAFYLEDNKVRRWYHVPWQHWGPNGREGLHGLTQEVTSRAFYLGPRQKTPAETWAVGFYNARGGWLIGRVWAEADNPDPGAVRRANGFPVGTVVAKLLFTTAAPDEVDYLTNPVQWSAFVYPAPGAKSTGTRKPTDGVIVPVRLVQVDMMVRDDRAKATGGWVFGTYVYNGALKRRSPWLNLVPVGLMWGNDPDVRSQPQATPGSQPYNPDLKETVINRADPMLPFSHLGYGLRLSGPVDNNLSSCKSCHMTAQYPEVSPILPTMTTTELGRKPVCGDATWMRWFRNLGPDESFDPQAQTTDSSLQLAASIQNFVASRNQNTGGLYASQFWKNRAMPITGLRGSVPEGGDPCRPVG